MVEITKITREEFKRLIDAKPLAVIPVGSIEQHGPHCALGTDSLIAEALSQEACKQTDTLCVPTVFVGLSEHHKGFPGTLWTSHHSFFNYLFDIAKSLVYQGVKKLIFVNGHGGNTSLLANLCSQLRSQLNVISLVFQWWTPPTEVQRIFKVGAVHADGVETSMIAAVNPQLVDMKAFEQINPEEVPVEWGKEIEGIVIPLLTHEFSSTGIAGLLDVFSLEKGQKLKEAVIQRLTKVIQKLLEFQEL
ncbi:MAG: creatininase family protein [Candidatus Hodarchaeota archaeon]